MAWTWRLLNAAEDPIVAGPELEALGAMSEFATQADAETWIGESWPALVEHQIAAVTLLQDGRYVYGPMGLSEG